MITTSLFADDIVMECKFYDNESILKFESGLFKDKIYSRVNGKWIKWCSDESTMSTMHGILQSEQSRLEFDTVENVLTINEKSAECSSTQIGRTDYIDKQWFTFTYVVDFEFLKKTMYYSRFNEDFKLLDEQTEKYSCTKL